MLLLCCSCKKEGQFNSAENDKPNSMQELTDADVDEETRGVEDMIESFHKDESRDVKAYLILGIDRSGEADSVGTTSGGGQSDGIYILALDNSAKKFTILQLNRDTYTDIIVPDFYGNPMSTKKDRLTRAFSLGSGLDDSCINAERTISNFLHGLEFSGYVALYYDGIAPAVDVLGGLDVPVNYDMTNIDENFVAGSILHMTGQQAYKFCRARTGVGDEANSGRMDRQRSFLGSFINETKNQLHSHSALINDIYNSAENYIVSDMSKGDICNIAAKALGYTDGGIRTIAGTESWVIGSDGNRFNIFEVDESDLQKMLKELFALEN